jgi:uncharacterized protein with PIN domain
LLIRDVVYTGKSRDDNGQIHSIVDSLTQSCTFRFYAELNDFLPANNRQRNIAHRFRGTPSVKDTIEAIGVPHTEVDLIFVDGDSVGFEHLLTGGERVAVYPMFERFEIAQVMRLRPVPLREPRFVLDVHLGKLAHYLRLIGFDSLYRNDYSDGQIVRLSVDERRIILTRDRGILKHSAVTHGYWLRNTDTREQLKEVVRAFDLRPRMRPFSRCMECNSTLRSVKKETILEKIPAGVARDFQEFSECPDCDRVYWRGSHYDRLTSMLQELLLM